MDSFEFASFRFPRKIPQLVPTSYCGTPEVFKRPAGRKHHYKVSGSYYGSPTPITKENPKTGDGFYLDCDFHPGLRWTWCDKIADIRIDHRGWWTNDLGDGETIRGVVFRLPHGRGFLAGHAMGEGMLSTLCCKVWDNERDAAYEADRMAERAAQKERDYQRAWRAGMDAADLETTIRDFRTELLALIREFREFSRLGRVYPTLRAFLMEDIRELLGSIRKARKERDELKADYSAWQPDAYYEGYRCGG